MITTAGMKNLSDDFNFKEKEKAQYTLLQFRGGGGNVSNHILSRTAKKLYEKTFYHKT